MRIRVILLPLSMFALSGCVSTMVSVVTAPVRVAGKAADWATTSQAEADRNRGRELRQREERVGRLARQRDKAQQHCDNGDTQQCARAEVLDHEIEAEMARPI